MLTDGVTMEQRQCSCALEGGKIFVDRTLTPVIGKATHQAVKRDILHGCFQTETNRLYLRWNNVKSVVFCFKSTHNVNACVSCYLRNTACCSP